MNMFRPRPAAASIDPEWEVAPEEVRRRLDAEEPMVLLDCRTDGERAVAAIEPSLHVPMDALGERLDELRPDPATPIVVYCHHGVRSLRVAAALRRAGLDPVHSMAGGIDRWSTAVDPGTPRY